jgi:ABC-type transporter Mla MlaB component
VLRIYVISHAKEGTRFEVEGRLVGAWVEELRRLSDQALAESAALSLDLEKLWYADLEGVALLRDLERRNVVHVNCSPFIQQQLKEAAPCKA